VLRIRFDNEKILYEWKKAVERQIRKYRENRIKIFGSTAETMNLRELTVESPSNDSYKFNTQFHKKKSFFGDFNFSSSGNISYTNSTLSRMRAASMNMARPRKMNAESCNEGVYSESSSAKLIDAASIVASAMNEKIIPDIDIEKAEEDIYSFRDAMFEAPYLADDITSVDDSRNRSLTTSSMYSVESAHSIAAPISK